MHRHCVSRVHKHTITLVNFRQVHIRRVATQGSRIWFEKGHHHLPITTRMVSLHQELCILYGRTITLASIRVPVVLFASTTNESRFLNLNWARQIRSQLHELWQSWQAAVTHMLCGQQAGGKDLSRDRLRYDMGVDVARNIMRAQV